MRCLALVLLLGGLLAGCQTNSVIDDFSESITDLTDFNEGEDAAQYEHLPEQYLSVVIPVFDTGITEEDTSKNEAGIWPELRRAEANRFANKLKRTLEDEEVFGAIRVMPTEDADADLIVQGEIEQSTANEIAFSLRIYDATGKLWDKEYFEYETDLNFYNDPRNKNKDAYDPIFKEATAHIIDLLKRRHKGQLQTIKNVSAIKFATKFSPEHFGKYLKTEDGITQLTGLPADNDTLYQRVRAIRSYDQLFVDTLQTNYEDFSDEMDESYSAWQKESLEILKAKEDAEQSSMMEKLAAAGNIALGVISVAAASQQDDFQILHTINAANYLSRGVENFQDMGKYSEEIQMHSANLNELGQSLQIKLGNNVIELEGEIINLTGDAEEQYVQWQAQLKKIFDLQMATPDKIL